MSGPVGSSIRKSLRRVGKDMHLPGPPFQFKVRTDKSIRFEEETLMVPFHGQLRDIVTLVPSFTTKNLDQSRREVLRLYRKICNKIPELLTVYDAWHVSTQNARDKVKAEFRKNAHIRDVRVIDKLRIKGEMELQNWGLTRYHLNTVYRFLTPEEQRNPIPDLVKQKQDYGNSKFLTDFFAGSDYIDK
mmetsp:Transcript_62286/g.76296  ORF Transcript_62286/g.76296 Transcript_62286/m.76296 type:complete len:188 (-) Transcript_62286:1175-1738(-)